MKVFIADDSEVVRERLIEMLSELPEIEIIGQAKDGLEAINSIAKLKPDVVILDISIPRRSGIDVLQNIKKDNPTLIVIILTSYPHPQYRKKCMDLGANYFFDKSTEFERVTEVIQQLIQDSDNEEEQI